MLSPRCWKLLSLLSMAALACGQTSRRNPAEFTSHNANALTVCAGTTVPGVDVSEFQGNINWGAFHAGGYGFAITRIGDGLYHDPTFATNWAGIKANGMVRGAYLFFEAGDDPTAQGNAVVAAVGRLGPGDLPVTIDLESGGGYASTGAIQTWMNVVTAGTGKTPMIYTAPGYWDGHYNNAFSSNPMWVADWGPSCPDMPIGFGTWQFWQHADNGSGIPGIPATVDLDVFNGSLPALEDFAGSGCTPSCNGTVITNADCGTGDCAVFGATCVNDNLGARCVFGECPAQGTTAICLNSTTIGNCNNGALSQGDCGAFGSTCVDDNLGARCVFSECPAQGTSTICTTGTEIGTCTNGALTQGDCSVYGATCFSDSSGARCVFAGCPPTGTVGICVSSTEISTCTNGAPSTPGDCSVYGATCVNDNLGARCVFGECPAQGTTTICLNSSTLGTCTNGALAQGDCGEFGSICVDDSLGARCVFSECPAQGTVDICLINGQGQQTNTLGHCVDGALTTDDCTGSTPSCNETPSGAVCGVPTTATSSTTGASTATTTTGSTSTTGGSSGSASTTSTTGHASSSSTSAGNTAASSTTGHASSSTGGELTTGGTASGSTSGTTGGPTNAAASGSGAAGGSSGSSTSGASSGGCGAAGSGFSPMGIALGLALMLRRRMRRD